MEVSEDEEGEGTAPAKNLHTFPCPQVTHVDLLELTRNKPSHPCGNLEDVIGGGRGYRDGGRGRGGEARNGLVMEAVNRSWTERILNIRGTCSLSVPLHRVRGGHGDSMTCRRMIDDRWVNRSHPPVKLHGPLARVGDTHPMSSVPTMGR